MKKFLYATTALALSAGVASAEIRFSGDARMGLNYNSGAGATAAAPAPDGQPTVRLEKRFTLNIDASTETDAGVTLGARVRIRSDEQHGADGHYTGLSGARVFASFGGLTVAAGNIRGAIEDMPNLYAPSVGLTGLGFSGLVTNVSEVGPGDRHFDWDSFASRANGAEGIEVIWSGAGFTLHASYSDDGLRGLVGPRQRTAIHASAELMGFTFALGFQDSTVAGIAPAANIEDKVVGTIGGEFGDFEFALGYAQNGDGANRINKFALSGSTTFDAWTVKAYVASQDRTPTAIVGFTPKRESYGLGVAYALGGGAALEAGVESTVHGTVRGDAGVRFRF